MPFSKSPWKKNDDYAFTNTKDNILKRDKQNLVEIYGDKLGLNDEAAVFSGN